MIGNDEHKQNDRGGDGYWIDDEPSEIQDTKGPSKHGNI